MNKDDILLNGKGIQIQIIFESQEKIYGIVRPNYDNTNNNKKKKKKKK